MVTDDVSVDDIKIEDIKLEDEKEELSCPFALSCEL